MNTNNDVLENEVLENEVSENIVSVDEIPTDGFRGVAMSVCTHGDCECN